MVSHYLATLTLSAHYNTIITVPNIYSTGISILYQIIQNPN